MIKPIPLRKLNDEQNPSTIAACFIARDATRWYTLCYSERVFICYSVKGFQSLC